MENKISRRQQHKMNHKVTNDIYNTVIMNSIERICIKISLLLQS